MPVTTPTRPPAAPRLVPVALAAMVVLGGCVSFQSAGTLRGPVDPQGDLTGVAIGTQAPITAPLATDDAPLAATPSPAPTPTRTPPPTPSPAPTVEPTA